MKKKLKIAWGRLGVPLFVCFLDFPEKGDVGNVSQGVPKPPGCGKRGEHALNPGGCIPVEHWKYQVKWHSLMH